MKRLLVTVDSLRYDHYQHMPNTRSTLGESHDRAFAVASATAGAFPQMMSGHHDTTAHLEPGVSWIHEVDDPTLGITSNRLTSERYGYGGGFDTFISPLSEGDISLKDRVASRVPNGTRMFEMGSRIWSIWQRLRPTKTAKSFREADNIIREFQDWSSGKSNWFAWLHLMEPHHPYDPNKSELSRTKSQVLTRDVVASNGGGDTETARALYRQEVEETDAKLAALWDWIPDNTKVIFTADHGEMLGENDIWGHPGQTFHPKILRIPFATKNIEVDSPVVSFIDVPAYLLGHDWKRSCTSREIAYASMNGKKCVFDRNHLYSADGAITLDDGNGDPDPRLQRAFDNFDPNQITKTDGVEEDLRALGYI